MNYCISYVLNKGVYLFLSICAFIMQHYPTYNVMLRAKAVNEYRKTLPFKNGGVTSPANLKPDVAFHVGTFSSIENEIRNLLGTFAGKH